MRIIRPPLNPVRVPISFYLYINPIFAPRFLLKSQRSHRRRFCALRARLPSGRFAPSAPSPSAPALRPSAGAPLRGSPASRLPLPVKCLAASGQKLGSDARLRRAVPRTPPRTTRTAAAAARSQGAFEKSRGDRRRSIPNGSAARKAARLNARKEGGRGACNLIRPPERTGRPRSP